MKRVLSLLKLSGLVINLDKSRDYFLLLLIINVFIVLLSYSANVEGKYVLLLASILFLQIIKVSKIKKPHPDLESLSYTGKHWSLKFRDGRIEDFTKLKIRLDSGFFSVIALYGGTVTKNIVIFNDQISADNRRHMYILAKLMR